MAKKMETTELSQMEVSQASATIVPHKEDPLLRASEAGELVGVSANTIRNWVAQRLIKCVRDPSGTARVRKSDLIKFYSASAFNERNPLPPQEE